MCVGTPLSRDNNRLRDASDRSRRGQRDCLSPFSSTLRAPVAQHLTQPRSSHSRLMVASRSPVPLHTKADAPTSTDRCLLSGSFIAENTTTLACGLFCLI